MLFVSLINANDGINRDDTVLHVLRFYEQIKKTMKNESIRTTTTTRKIVIDFIFVLTIQMKINIVLLETRACHTYTTKNCKSVTTYDAIVFLNCQRQNNCLRPMHTHSMHQCAYMRWIRSKQTLERKKKQNSQKGKRNELWRS